MRRILVVVLFATLVAPVLGQTTHNKTKPGTNTWGGGNGSFFFNSGSFGHRGGFFPFVPIGHGRGSGLFLNRFLFFDHRPTAAGTGYEYLFGGNPYYSPYSYYSYYPYGGYGSPYGMSFFGYPGFDTGPALYNSARFVEEWKDRDPIAGAGSESQDSGLQQSILLKDGMDEDQVVQAIGSPVQRVQLGERTVWKYSGYSLLFEGGKLKEIR
ncbi:MAG: hypothetical protein EHM23_17990 [Acidobacteria bacterium]|nr:MAG: hypothetical protein EHM23_17990 [Acidobacteriota bacterium]